MLNMATRPAARVLVADDQPDVLEALRWLLTGEGYEPEFVSSTDAVLERLRERPFDLLLMDLNYSRDTTSGREGLELIPKVRALDSSLPIVVMTGWGSVDTAVEAMRHGARSFVQKPWEDVMLLEILQREIEESQATKRSDAKQKREFEEARLIQRGLLPTTTPQIPGLRLASSWQPANGVGGDCFDMLTFGTGAMGVYIADVAAGRAGRAPDVEPPGRGPRSRSWAAPGSLVPASTACSAQHGRQRTFRDVLLRAHRRGGGEATYANAGHNPPLLVRGQRRDRQAVAGGTVLGVFARAPTSRTRASSRRSSDPLHRRHDRKPEPRGRIRRGRDRAASAAQHRARRRGDARRDARDIEGFNGAA